MYTSFPFTSSSSTTARFPDISPVLLTPSWVTLNQFELLCEISTLSSATIRRLSRGLSRERHPIGEFFLFVKVTSKALTLPQKQVLRRYLRDNISGIRGWKKFTSSIRKYVMYPTLTLKYHVMNNIRRLGNSKFISEIVAHVR